MRERYLCLRMAAEKGRVDVHLKDGWGVVRGLVDFRQR
jgi:hypothetical protein